MMTTLEKAETHLNSCVGCSKANCYECAGFKNMLDSLMALRTYEQEISALEDAYDADVDYYLSIA